MVTRMSKVREREKESVIQESDRVLILGWVGGGSEGAWLDHDRDVWSNGVWWVGGRAGGKSKVEVKISLRSVNLSEPGVLSGGSREESKE